MIHIQKRALRSFKKQPLVLLHGIQQEFRRIANQWAKFLGVLGILLADQRMV